MKSLGYVGYSINIFDRINAMKRSMFDFPFWLFVLAGFILFLMFAPTTILAGDTDVRQSNDMNNQSGTIHQSNDMNNQTGTISNEMNNQTSSEMNVETRFGATLNGGHMLDGDVSLTDGDVTVEGPTISTENNSSNIVLVPNNNSEGCLRVFGFSWGNGDSAGALGWPWRSKPCDFEQAADDAAATGQHELAWFWRCHKPNIYKTFRDRGESVDTAITDCFEKMTSMFVPISQVVEDTDTLVAQVSEEEFDDHAEEIEDLYAEQQRMIDILEEENEEKDKEIRRLEEEAAEREIEDAKDEQRRAAARAVLDES